LARSIFHLPGLHLTVLGGGGQAAVLVLVPVQLADAGGAAAAGDGGGRPGPAGGRLVLPQAGPGGGHSFSTRDAAAAAAETPAETPAGTHTGHRHFGRARLLEGAERRTVVMKMVVVVMT